MNENYTKICFISVVRDTKSYQECLNSLQMIEIPENIVAEVISITDADSLASGYNQGMRSSDAEYKIYLKDTIKIINRNFIDDFRQIFQQNEQIGIIGVAGADEVIINGDVFNLNTLKINEKNGVYETAYCLNSSLLITSRDFK